MIEVNDLTKSYGHIQALRGINFTIAAGEIVGLLGPNGAGKTTIIKILTGYLQQDQGTAVVDGLDVIKHSREVQANIGYLPENAPLYPELSVQSYLKMIARLREIPENDILQRISDAVYSVGLHDQLTRPIGQLSKGYRQRLGLAQAILNRPKLLILDEPTVGLDPTQIIEIRQLIKRLALHSTILFSTHILPEVEALCDRAIIIMNGLIKADARLADLASTSNAVLVLDQVDSGIEKSLMSVKGVNRVEAFNTEDNRPAFRVFAEDRVDINPEIFHLASEKKWHLRELRRDVRKLETVFNELTMAA